MNLNKYKGIFPAFYACFDSEGNVSTQATKDFVEYLISKGANTKYDDPEEITIMTILQNTASLCSRI